MSELFLSLFGLIFTYGGIIAIKKNLNLKKVGIRTIGTVISTRAVSRKNNSVDDVELFRATFAHAGLNPAAMCVAKSKSTSGGKTLSSFVAHVASSGAGR